MACEEMQLFYAYLDSVEEAKRKAQPWECEVTIIPQDALGVPAEVAPAPASNTKAGKSGFSCDEPE
jgi:hypothetical protein